ncbi:YSC84-related protein [Desulfospira joergensenii]|uniref:YSC84-related protein n=1 Tax=Desulfospira joergensenii TaxID=53329 RepID=UPI0013768D5C|nr:YSC84-related protein [Desulfospira joergensenii]
MKMYSAGVGLGLGVKDFRGIFIFTTHEALNEFVEKGWQAGGQADAVAKSGAKGGGAGSAIDIAPGIRLYQITKNGLALQATVQGTKYWKDKEMNHE